MEKQLPQVEIRAWKLNDALALSKVISNKAVQDNLRDGIPFPYTEQDGAEFIETMLNADASGTFAFAITCYDEVVGSIGAFRQNNIHNRTAEMGYYIAEAYWGKGITTEAVKLLCSHIFGNTDIIRIFAEPFSQNTASCRVLEKAGFTYEGTLYANAIKNGNILDMKMYALLR
ncbi:MAG: GNAT family N-acetyltransferase [Clostridiales Family XIII bacterium]|jgi:RimJ/RimL family protein N-acetyltransferase|nr:GNAT family N-acetyltransferase [Clostridiales Family XIII bacterium]